jgi:diamine N-acetyltransferase
MTIQLKNEELVELGQLKNTDLLLLYAYFQQLSSDTRTRFAPHSFDWETVKRIESDLDQPIKRFIALRPAYQELIAYTILHLGLAPGDLERYQR